MAPTPSQRSILLNYQTPTKNSQSKQRLHFPNPKCGTNPNPSVNLISATPTEHPIEVIGRIRDYPERKDNPSASSLSSALEIADDGHHICVRSDVGYRDFILDGISLSENEDLDGFYKRFVETRLEGVRSGAKCTIMVYGPTGAGKSHTMFGCGKEPGIVYRALKDILRENDRDRSLGVAGFGISMFVRVAVLEIYNEEIYDLLSGGHGNGAGTTGMPISKGSTPKAKLEVMGRKVKNATYLCGNEPGKISREVAKVEKRRIVKSTLLNERSSRSHCVIILDVPSVGGRLMLVDMAGSENIEQAGQGGFEAKMQTGKINQGNIALKRVVESIANGDSHVPFRDSKLTMLLQDPMGAPVTNEAEPTILVSKLPSCSNQLNTRLASLRPTKNTVSLHNNHLPFTSLENNTLSLQGVISQP